MASIEFNEAGELETVFKLTIDDVDRITDALERRLKDVSEPIPADIPQDVADSIREHVKALEALLEKLGGDR